MDIIRHSIIPEKSKAWHNFIHPYFTKQATNVVRDYILHFSKKGDVVLDPFGGTGVTAIEALANNRKAILIDINPFATFISEQTIKKVNIDLLKEEFGKIQHKWGGQIYKIDNLKEEDLKNEKIPFWYPKNIPLPSNADDDLFSVECLWTKKQLIGLSMLWQAINEIKDSDIKNQLKLVFSGTISRVNLTYNLSQTRQTGDKVKLGDGGAALFAQYRYWKPENIVELPVWDRFADRFRRVSKAKEEWNKITHGIDVNNNYEIYNGSALELSKYVSTKSVDYIYTDPPYGANIAYLDLSTMWNAWLGFNITKKMREDEIIEGGELQKTKENYEELFSKSFEEMAKVLKKDKWISVVFAHKKLEFWNTIISSCEDNGMEFIGSTFQPTNNSSIHYKKNPANVLCSQRVASFKKTFQKSNRQKPDDYKQFVIDEIMNVCKTLNGASLDVITNKVLDKLHNSTTDIHEFKKRGYTNIYSILDDPEIFEFNEADGLYYIKDWKKNQHDYEKEYYKNKDELKIFIQSILKQKKPMKLEQLQNDVLDVFNQDKKVPIKHKDFFELLQELATPNKKTGYWAIKPYIQQKIEFEFLTPEQTKLIKIKPEGFSHSEIIYRLGLIGKYLNFKCWVGKREQSVGIFNNVSLKSLSINKLELLFKDEIAKEKVEQIDLIWIDKLGTPRYAFEIEESTSIETGLDRFKYLLTIEHSIANNLCIVAPKTRKRKLEKVFYNSTYVGEPLYMDNKVKFVFKEDLIRFYDKNIGKDFDEIDLKAIFSKVEK